MAQRLLLVALCAVIAVQLISSVEGASKHGCIKRCNTGCHKRNKNVMDCLKDCYQTYPKSCQKCKKNDDRCYGCLPGFMLSNAKCIPCATGCICDQTSTCLDCRPGYVKTPNGCAVCNPGCNCDSTGACTCQTGYVASATYDPTKPSTTGPQCLACPPNCADCSSTGPTECFTCKPGYTLLDNVCQPCITGCLDCTSGLTSCDVCKTGYHRNVGASPITCTACPANCVSCDTFNTTYCDACIEGYGLTRNRKGCIACAPNCKTCNWDGYNSCDSHQCATGWAWDSTAKKCTLDCTALTTCERCADATHCEKCMAGYTLSAGACTATDCPTAITNCAKCSATDSTKCEICDSGYAVATAGTSCISCIAVDASAVSCTLDSSDAVIAITRCLEGFIPGIDSSSASTPKPPICWPCVWGCKDCTSASIDTTTGLCKTCYSAAFTLTAGACVFATCSADCAPPYCTGNNGCDLNCRKGYVLDTATHTCVPCEASASSHCNRCLSSGSTLCDGPQCKAGYIITANNKCSKA